MFFIGCSFGQLFFWLIFGRFFFSDHQIFNRWFFGSFLLCFPAFLLSCFFRFGSFLCFGSLVSFRWFFRLFAACFLVAWRFNASIGSLPCFFSLVFWLFGSLWLLFSPGLNASRHRLSFDRWRKFGSLYLSKKNRLFIDSPKITIGENRKSMLYEFAKNRLFIP